jgi:dihydroorotate dehydrogenase (fumarate)
MLDSHYRLQNIDIIGVGGVMDGAGFRRMVNVGADVVAVGTALGIRGMDVFESIIKEVKSSS